MSIEENLIECVRIKVMCDKHLCIKAKLENIFESMRHKIGLIRFTIRLILNCSLIWCAYQTSFLFLRIQWKLQLWLAICIQNYHIKFVCNKYLYPLCLCLCFIFSSHVSVLCQTAQQTNRHSIKLIKDKNNIHYPYLVWTKHTKHNLFIVLLAFAFAFLALRFPTILKPLTAFLCEILSSKQPASEVFS